MRILVFIFILHVSFGCFLIAQDNWFLQPSLDYGFIPKHNPNIVVDPSQFRNLQAGLELSYRRVSNHNWRKRYRYPAINMGLFYTGFGDKDVYGQAFSMLPTMQFSLMEKDKYQLLMKTGIGLSYMTRYYHKNNNNTAIGSAWNNVTTLQFFGAFGTETIKFLAGIGVTHFSNAALRQPNLGLNLVHGKLGFSWRFAQKKIPAAQLNSMESQQGRYDKWRTIINLQIGAFDYEEVQFDLVNKIGLVYTANATVGYHTSRINRILSGLKVSYNRGREIRNGPETAMVVALYIGDELLIGKLGLMLTTGIYLRQRYDANSRFFTEFRLNYYPMEEGEGVFIGLGLKNHLEVAEFPFLTIGYGF